MPAATASAAWTSCPVGARKGKGYSILYLTDEPDEFVMNMLGSYENKQFKSINADDLGIEDQESKDEIIKQEKEYKELLEFVKDSLDGSVAAVKLSNKQSHPVCFVITGRYFA